MKSLYETIKTKDINDIRLITREGMVNSDMNEAEDDDITECHICLEPITAEVKAVPDCCSHEFCYVCLQRWSYRTNTCPIDRKMYRCIRLLDTVTQCETASRTVEEIDFTRFCEICRTDADDKGFFTYCEGCDNFLHQQCRGIGIVTEHVRRWLCPECDVTPTMARDRERNLRERRRLRARRRSEPTRGDRSRSSSRENRQAGPLYGNVLQRARFIVDSIDRFIRNFWM